MKDMTKEIKMATALQYICMHIYIHISSRSCFIVSFYKVTLEGPENNAIQNRQKYLLEKFLEVPRNQLLHFSRFFIRMKVYRNFSNPNHHIFAFINHYSYPNRSGIYLYISSFFINFQK